MIPEGASVDDLKVRLFWPGSEFVDAGDEDTPPRHNGGSSPSDAGPKATVSEAAPVTVASVPAESELESIRQILAAMSARMDAMGDSQGASAPYGSTWGAAFERMEQAISQLTRMITDSEERSARALHEILQRTEEAAEQLRALRRRVALRGRAENLSPESIDMIAEAVAARLSDTQARRRIRRT
jgi:hypothetical protein